jgi:predicted dehydrogenase
LEGVREQQNEEGTKLRAAVIGCGRVGAIHAEALATQGRVELVAVCDPQTDRAGTLAQRWGGEVFRDWQTLLASTSPDIVAIATPDDAHVEPTLASLESGSHVFCEKPLATSLAGATTMVATAKRMERTLAVDFNRRFGFAYRRALGLIKKGRIGKPSIAALQVIDGFPPMQVRTSATAMLTTLLTHHFDLLRWLVGDVVAVRTTGLLDDASGLVTPMAITLHCRDGVLATVTASYQPHQARTWESLMIAGPEGRLIAEDVVGPLRVSGADSETVETMAPPANRWEDAFWRTIRLHVRAFVESIASGGPPPVTGDDGLASLRIATAAALSWTESRAVEVDHEDCS